MAGTGGTQRKVNCGACDRIGCVGTCVTHRQGADKTGRTLCGWSWEGEENGELRLMEGRGTANSWGGGGSTVPALSVVLS